MIHISLQIPHILCGTIVRGGRARLRPEVEQREPDQMSSESQAYVLRSQVELIT